MQPLAERVRPKDLNSYTGQEHIIGEGTALRNAISQNLLPSLILWGPPGVGKTTLALIISQALKRPFYALSAINSGVKDVREVIEKAQQNNLFTHEKNVFIPDISFPFRFREFSLCRRWKPLVVAFFGCNGQRKTIFGR